MGEHSSLTEYSSHFRSGVGFRIVLGVLFLVRAVRFCAARGPFSERFRVSGVGPCRVRFRSVLGVCCCPFRGSFSERHPFVVRSVNRKL